METDQELGCWKSRLGIRGIVDLVVEDSLLMPTLTLSTRVLVNTCATLVFTLDEVSVKVSYSAYFFN